MSFTIRCDQCGNELKLRTGSSRLGDKIQIIPDISGKPWQEGWTVHGIDFYCENPSCNNHIETN